MLSGIISRRTSHLCSPHEAAQIVALPDLAAGAVGELAGSGEPLGKRTRTPQVERLRARRLASCTRQWTSCWPRRFMPHPMQAPTDPPPCWRTPSKRGALLQTDLAAYYDNVDVVRVGMAGVARGVSSAVAAAAVRQQLLPTRLPSPSGPVTCSAALRAHAVACCGRPWPGRDARVGRPCLRNARARRSRTSLRSAAVTGDVR